MIQKILAANTSHSTKANKPPHELHWKTTHHKEVDLGRQTKRQRNQVQHTLDDDDDDNKNKNDEQSLNLPFVLLLLAGVGPRRAGLCSGSRPDNRNDDNNDANVNDARVVGTASTCQGR